MNRPPDSRVPVGQRIEDELDAITDSVRREGRRWVTRLRAGASLSDTARHSSIIGGLAGTILDELHEMTGGDPDRMRAAWGIYIESYLDAGAEDAAADAQ